MTGPEWYELWQKAGEPRTHPTDVPCRTCGAPEGRYCVKRSGHKHSSAHAVRWDDALRLAAGVSIPETDQQVLPVEGEAVA